MPKGGRRRGRPGKAYANRLDLNAGGPLPVSAAPSSSYGSRVAQESAQRAVPLAPSPVPTPPAGPLGPPTPAFTGPPAGSFGDLARPTERPGEPLTSGIASGAGPGPEALGLAGDFTHDELRALYLASPNEDLRELLEDIDEGGL